MTDAEIKAEFDRLNDQLTAIVGHMSNIEAVVMFHDRKQRNHAYHALMEASEANDGGVSWGGKNLRPVQDGFVARESGLEELDLTEAQLAEAKKKLAQARTREALERRREASRAVKRGKKCG